MLSTPELHSQTILSSRDHLKPTTSPTTTSPKTSPLALLPLLPSASVSAASFWACRRPGSSAPLPSPPATRPTEVMLAALSDLPLASPHISSSDLLNSSSLEGRHLPSRWSWDVCFCFFLLSKRIHDGLWVWGLISEFSRKAPSLVYRSMMRIPLLYDDSSRLRRRMEDHYFNISSLCSCDSYFLIIRPARLL